jgi:hypothetical protein
MHGRHTSQGWKIGKCPIIITVTPVSDSRIVYYDERTPVISLFSCWTSFFYPIILLIDTFFSHKHLYPCSNFSEISSLLIMVWVWNDYRGSSVEVLVPS